MKHNVFYNKTLISLSILGIIYMSYLFMYSLPNQTAIAGDPPKEPWVDGRVYKIENKEGQNTPVYISTQGIECGVNEGEIKVSDTSIDRCDSKGRPYYLLEEVKEGQNTFQLQISSSSEYTCDSWIAVESKNTSNVIARGKCTGAYSNEATYDNQGKNTSLWWKLKLIEIANDDGSGSDSDSSGIKPLEQPDYAGFGTNEGDSRVPESLSDLVPYTGSYTLTGQALQFTRGFSASGPTPTSQTIAVASKNQGNVVTNSGYNIRSFLTNDDPSTLGLTNQNFYSIWYGIPGNVKNQDWIGIMDQNQVVALREPNLSTYNLNQHNYLCMMVDSPDPDAPNGRVQESDENNNISCISKTELLNGGSATFSCANVTQIPQIECEALVALYDSTDGDNWINIPADKKWKQSNTPCTNWEGVTCTNNKVTSINLYTNNLSGNIPTQLGNLTNLQDLFLNNNQLTGNIPTQLGNLTNLQDLFLNSNQLTGSIPTQLGNLTNLQRLGLINNQLTGNIPTQLGNLTNLQVLFLNNNQLTGSIPFYDATNHLTSLVIFYYGGNNLCIEGGSTGQTANWLRAVEARDPGVYQVSPSPENATACAPTTSADLVPLSGGNFQNGVYFTGLTNGLNVGVKNEGTAGASNFNIKGVIVAQPITTPAQFNSAYAISTNPRGLVNIESIGTSSNNPKTLTMLLGNTNLSQHANKYMCVFVDGGMDNDVDGVIVESNENNNIGCRQIPVTDNQFVDLQPYTGTGASNLNYSGGVAFYTNSSNTLSVGVKNHGNQSVSQSFQIKGVISQSIITTAGVFNNTYNSAGADIKKSINITGIGTGSTNNPKYVDMAMVTNWSQHNGKYLCVFIDSALVVTETGYENNNIGCRQIPNNTQKPDLRGFTGSYSNRQYTYGASFIDNSTLGFAVKNIGQTGSTGQFKVRAFLTNDSVSGVTSNNFIDKWNQTQVALRSESNYSNNISTNAIGTGSMTFNLPLSVTIKSYNNLCIKFDSETSLTGNIVETDEWNNMGCIQTSQFGAPDLRILTNTYNGKVYTKGLTKGSTVNQVGYAVKNVGQSATQTSYQIKVFFTNEDVSSVTSGNFYNKFNLIPEAQKRNARWSLVMPAGTIISNVENFDTGFNYNNYQNVCVKFDSESTLVGRIPESDEWNNFGCGRVVDLLK